MAYEALQAVVGTAIVDSNFRRNLLKKAPDVLNSFELSPEEYAAIRAVQAKTFQGFVTELQSWITHNTVSNMRSAAF